METAVAMLEERCRLGIVDSAGATVLHFATKGGNFEFVPEVIGRRCDVNATKANAYTPLHYDAVRGTYT